MIAIEPQKPGAAAVMAAAQGRMVGRIQTMMRRLDTDGKEQLRAYIAARLTPRAAYLLTAKRYDEDTTVYFHSRWWRGPRGLARSRATQALDILAAHAEPGGTTIRPGRAGALIVSSARGRGERRRVARELKQAGIVGAFAGGGLASASALRVRIIPGRVGGNALAVMSRGQNRGQVLATLARSVHLPQRLERRAMLNLLRSVLRRRWADPGESIAA